ncbi:hypothetical protein [Butyrivibrio sp. WCD2001]|uniref:hypothetical protein n=1 Tax=Butyrivibrio sp. WCD2001 TaxID=1280681 RepID=UPI0004295B96|nr:hypothetical protein [Butyrivibrio sp. WCD2001]
MKRVFNDLGRFILLSAFALTLSAAVLISYPMRDVKAYVEETKNSDGTYTYTDSDTNESVTSKWKDGYAEKYIGKEEAACVIETKSYYNVIDLYTTLDVARLGNFRTNSDKLKVKVMYSHENNYGLDNADTSSCWIITPDGKKLYKDIYGNRKEFNASTEQEILKTNKFEAKGSYKIRLYTKKAGKYVFSYDALDHNGNVITTKTVKVVAKEDTDPIKEATFAGKRFYVSNVGKQKGLKTDLYNIKGGYNTKKSGKLKIIMNKGYKIKKIEMGYQHVERSKASTDDKWTNSFADVTWKTIKNGRKIKLNSENVYSYFDKYEKKSNEKAPGGYDIYSDENHGQISTTYIRVTYYDTKSKRTERTQLSINRNIK